MTTTLDLPNFYSQARAQFAVRQKSSGQLLGYALLLPEAHIENSQVKLVRWQDDDLHTTDSALAVGQEKSPFSHSSLTNLNQNLNLSSASEESSMNNTLTSQCASDLPASQADFNASVSLAKLPTSTPEQMPSLSSSLTSMSSAVSSGFSPSARSVTSSKIGFSVISSPYHTVPTVTLSSVREDNDVDNCSEIQEGDASKCLVPKRRNSDNYEIEKDSMNDSDPDCKPKSIKLDENENLKVECGDIFLPGAVHKYDFFIEDLNPELKLKDRKLKRVRCLLCDGKVMSADLLTGDYIALTMTSAKDKNVFLKIGLEKGDRVKKAMKIFGKKFNTEYRSLKFFLKNTELSGGEVVADLEGSEISVFGDLIN